jgi:7,8-dihydropterin-6-yl-methyl-4-(beta-D-ribofuranosyl)aminobenzene 5'-phosphate synthase
LILDSAKGLVVICGCAHAGIENILEYVVEQTGKRHIHALIGGTHLGFFNEEQWKEAFSVIEHFEIDRIGVSHCTGPSAAAWLYHRLPGRFFFAGVGTQLTF